MFELAGRLQRRLALGGPTGRLASQPASQPLSGAIIVSSRGDARAGRLVRTPVQSSPAELCPVSRSEGSAGVAAAFPLALEHLDASAPAGWNQWRRH